MKKFLMVFFITLFVSLSANASSFIGSIIPVSVNDIKVSNAKISKTVGIGDSFKKIGEKTKANTVDKVESAIEAKIKAKIMIYVKKIAIILGYTVAGILLLVILWKSRRKIKVAAVTVYTKCRELFRKIKGKIFKSGGGN